ncbi:MAG TPA: TfuA-like protein [Bauldia sp.]|nr:TfuA-like protein [Bauldia sp.]
MKVVFAGPSLPDAADHARTAIVRGPAALGDVAKAAVEGAAVIGIVDGYFENIASVWHKEILYALSQGVHVVGAASMGALRAAECAAYGMVGIGAVYAAYADSTIVDDDAVGQVHGPAELDYIALTEPLVNMRATLADLRTARAITGAEHEALAAAADTLFFKQRTWANLLATVPTPRRAEIAKLAAVHRRDLKREDALALIDAVEGAPAVRRPPPTAWRFMETQMWTRLLEGWRRDLAAAA